MKEYFCLPPSSFILYDKTGTMRVTRMSPGDTSSGEFEGRLPERSSSLLNLYELPIYLREFHQIVKMILQHLENLKMIYFGVLVNQQIPKARHSVDAPQQLFGNYAVLFQRRKDTRVLFGGLPT